MSIEIILADPNKAMRHSLRTLFEREPDLAVVPRPPTPKPPSTWCGN